jgi:hypothetical protein
MLLASDIGDESKLAEEMCGAVEYYGIKKEHLSRDQVRGPQDKLVLTKEINGHELVRNRYDIFGPSGPKQKPR